MIAELNLQELEDIVGGDINSCENSDDNLFYCYWPPDACSPICIPIWR